MKKPNLFRYRSFLPPFERKILSYTILGLTLSTGAFLAITGGHDKKSTLMMSKLDVLQRDLVTLQKSADKPIPSANLTSMIQQIHQLSEQLNHVRTQNSTHVDEALNQTEMSLTKQLDVIQRLVRQLANGQTNIIYLPANKLPFKVLSIDSIQHIPVASVTYDFKTIPLEKDDSLAGWQILHLDYGKQVVEFVNAKKEHVLLTREQIG